MSFIRVISVNSRIDFPFFSFRTLVLSIDRCYNANEYTSYYLLSGLLKIFTGFARILMNCFILFLEFFPSIRRPCLLRNEGTHA